MTPFRNDDDNPFSRPSVWPKMPQAPMSLGRPAPRADASAGAYPRTGARSNSAAT